MIDRDCVQRVKDETDLVKLVGQSVKLRRRGKSHVGLCPFHQEKSPSFHVSPKKNTYFCYGCHESGDAIEWQMKQYGLSFKEAMSELAGELGIDLAQQDTSKWKWAQPRVVKPPAPPPPILTWPESSLELFNGRMAKYLLDRGITIDAAKVFGLGFDCQNKRAMFPIRKPTGELVGVTGRTIGNRKPKYLHYQLDTHTCRAIPWIERRFHESMSEDELDKRFRIWFRNRLLFGAQVVRRSDAPAGGWKSDDLFVHEGHIDAVKTWQRGHRSVAAMGTFVSSDQGDMLVSLVPPRGRLVVLFDPDPPGRKAAREVHEVVYQRVPLWNMELPGIRVPEGKVVSEMSDEELDACTKPDAGNCTDEEFETSLRKLTRLA